MAPEVRRAADHSPLPPIAWPDELPLPLAAAASRASVTWPPPSLGNKAYTGREWDAETGLYYYRARYYEPNVGRFTSEDPTSFAGEPHVFAYVRNRPTASTDPSGLVDINYLAPNTPAHQGAENWNPPDFFTIAAHGTPVPVKGEKVWALLDAKSGRRVYPEELANEIRKTGKWKSGSVKRILIVGCWAAKGRFPYIEALWGELDRQDVTVTGATGLVVYYAGNKNNGYGGFEPDIYDPEGSKWKTYP